MVICSRQTTHHLNSDIRNLVMVLTKRGNNSYTFLLFDNEFLASSKQFNCVPDIIFFQSNRSKYVITIPGVFCLEDWCLTTSLWIYFHISHNKQHIQWRSIHFPKSSMMPFTCTKYLCMTINEKNELLIQKRHYVCIISLKDRNEENIWLVCYLYILMR